MEPQKKLTIRPAGRLDDDARAAYARAMRHDTNGGLRALAEVLAGAELFEVVDESGAVVLRYALRVDKHAEGAEGVIVAAVGKLPGVDLCELFVPVIEAQLQGAAAVKVTTRRMGLAKKLMDKGYEFGGLILRKPLVVA